MLCWELCMLLPSYNTCEETYSVYAAAPLLTNLKTVYLYCAELFTEMQSGGRGRKRWLCSH